MQLTPLKENVLILKDYFENSPVSFCDISVGNKYMWRDLFVQEYAIIDDTLICCESTKDYQNAFYFPMGKNEENALKEIESYQKSRGEDVLFCCIDNEKASFLTTRYRYVKVSNDRAWSDYIYDAEKFKTYSGKKFSGQRNHVNKFNKTYNYTFKRAEISDVEKIREFLDKNGKETEITDWTAVEERNKLSDMVEKAFSLGQLSAFIEVDGKVIAYSLGEIVKDTLIVHVEKADRSYDGVYPTLASLFAKEFCTPQVKYINREEDCGDEGLRISKLQYHPIEVKEKNFVSVTTAFSKIKSPFIKTDRLTIEDILKSDKKQYYKLCVDEENNKYFGYDYKEDCLGKPTPEYFIDFVQKLKDKKEEYDFAVKKDGKLVGELCLYNFDFYGTAELGFRILKKEQGKGYAIESAKALIDYAFNELKIVNLKARAFKQNIPSHKLLNKLGFALISEDEKFIYYKLER